MEVSSQRHDLAAFPTTCNPGTRRNGGWVGPRASFDVFEDRKICPYRKSNPLPSSPYPSRYTDYAASAPYVKSSFLNLLNCRE